MNSNFIISILIIIIFCLYYKYEFNSKNCVKISPKDYNPAIHHPAFL